jgi:hypothetical protein
MAALKRVRAEAPRDAADFGPYVEQLPGKLDNLNTTDPDGWKSIGQAADDAVRTIDARRRAWLMLKARVGAAEAERIARFVFGEGC